MKMISAARIACIMLALATLSLSPLGAYAAQGDSQLQIKVQKALSGSKFKNVQIGVEDGVVKLSGTVDVLADKDQAEKKVRRVHDVHAVDDEIRVAGPEIPDQVLEQKLVKGIEYDRVGYGTTAFNAIGVSVHNGVVTLGGHAYWAVDADSAVALAENTKGVQDVINNIQIDPTSPMDDQIRIAVYRSIYGYPALNKYAIDPGTPIRISVQNGRVTLYGVVDSAMDKLLAGMRANTVPNVFHVTNDLEIAGQAPEK